MRDILDFCLPPWPSSHPPPSVRKAKLPRVGGQGWQETFAKTLCWGKELTYEVPVLPKPQQQDPKLTCFSEPLWSLCSGPPSLHSRAKVSQSHMRGHQSASQGAGVYLERGPPLRAQGGTADEMISGDTLMDTNYPGLT